MVLGCWFTGRIADYTLCISLLYGRRGIQAARQCSAMRAGSGGSGGGWDASFQSLLATVTGVQQLDKEEVAMAAGR